MDLALEGDTIVKSLADIRFQSLFSWIWLSKSFRCGSIAASEGGFNPCFRGSVLSKSSRFDLVTLGLSVSILVFVDLALEGGSDAIDCARN